MKTNEKLEFWELNFIEKQELWGFEPIKLSNIKNHY